MINGTVFKAQQPLLEYTPEQWRSWLISGLASWDNPQTAYNAFPPISDRFSGNDDIEPQIACVLRQELTAMQNRRTFLCGLGLAFLEAPNTKDGARQFDSCQRLTGLMGSIIPIPYMIQKLLETDFLECQTPEVARHLFAHAILAIDQCWDSNTSPSALERLGESDWFGQEYIPYVLGIPHNREVLVNREAKP